MDTPAVREALRAAGCRWTTQRASIIDTIARRAGHFTAADVLEDVLAVNPAVERSTVYRTLDLLNELGLLAATTGDDGVIRFERRGDAPHHHLVCTACGAAIEVEDAAFEPLRTAISQHYGFRAAFEHWMVPGVGAGCAADR